MIADAIECRREVMGVQLLRLPVCAAAAPVAGVSRETEYEFMTRGPASPSSEYPPRPDVRVYAGEKADGVRR